MTEKNHNIKDLTCRDYIIHGIFFFFYGFVKYLPSPVGDILRYVIVKPFIKKIGKTRIYEGVTLWFPYRIKIGDNVTLNEWVYLSGFGEIEIGDNVRIGHRTSIITSDHIRQSRRIPIFMQGIVAGRVKIEKDVVIGCNVTILKDVTVGRGAIIAAGAVVAQDVPAYEIVGGVPAEKISQRD